MNIPSATAETIAEGARILRAGGLVAFPTETVYGLGGDATQGKTIARIFEAKGRPAFNPLIVHVADRCWVADLAEADDRFEKLARAFWPGPLTLVLRRRAGCPASNLVSAGHDTIAVRMPDHRVALELLRGVGRPLAAPSANASGTVSPTLAAHVAASLGDRIDLIIDGGPCPVGLESAVLDLTQTTAMILRPGVITAEDIARVIGRIDIAREDPAAPKSPGQLASHYAPSLPIRLNATIGAAGEALLGFGATARATLNLSPGGDLKEAAANLFAMLRALDDRGKFTAIAVATIPATGIGIAINDRLERAAAPRL
ncbi:MAG: threonylcarbamoyl-AMP synthase [Rhodospirillaceae bacterium]|nr:threonylcarbamoyl-AMP synthase [Rhodospirillaceae bacterium]